MTFDEGIYGQGSPIPASGFAVLRDCPDDVYEALVEPYGRPKLPEALMDLVEDDILIVWVDPKALDAHYGPTQSK